MNAPVNVQLLHLTLLSVWLKSSRSRLAFVRRLMRRAGARVRLLPLMKSLVEERTYLLVSTLGVVSGWMEGTSKFFNSNDKNNGYEVLYRQYSFFDAKNLKTYTIYKIFVIAAPASV